MPKLDLHYVIINGQDGGASVSFYGDEKSAQLAAEIEENAGAPFTNTGPHEETLEFDAKGNLLNPASTLAELQRELAEQNGEEPDESSGDGPSRKPASAKADPARKYKGEVWYTVVNEQDGGEDPEEPDQEVPANVKNYMTPHGFATLQAELHYLLREERPKMVEIVAWAAGNGDRSENGDYLYGKKRLREIDRRLRYLTKRLESAEVVDPKKQQGLDRVFFGATVTYAKEDDTEHTVTLVGPDEADVSKGKISWLSPVARALLKAQAGDEVEVRTGAKAERIEVLSVQYPL